MRAQTCLAASGRRRSPPHRPRAAQPPWSFHFSDGRRAGASRSDSMAETPHRQWRRSLSRTRRRSDERWRRVAVRESRAVVREQWQRAACGIGTQGAGGVREEWWLVGEDKSPVGWGGLLGLASNTMTCGPSSCPSTRVYGYGFGTSIPGPARPDESRFLPISSPVVFFLTKPSLFMAGTCRVSGYPDSGLREWLPSHRRLDRADSYPPRLGSWDDVHRRGRDGGP